MALVACPVGRASGQPAPGAGAPARPVVRLGALLPLSAAGAWFGAEIKQGLELAVAELDPSPRRNLSTSSAPSGSTTDEARESAPAEEKPSTPAGQAGTGADSAAADGDKPKAAGPPPEPIEPPDRPRTTSLSLQAQDVQPLDIRAASSEMTRLLGAGVTAVVTASATPTLAARPLASARDVLVLHAGLVGERFPAPGRTVLQLRPSVAARAEILAAHASERGIKRLALLAGGDDFGRGVRAGTGARWRKQGGHLVHEESLSLDAADLRSRLRAAIRSGPEAIVLGYQGAGLGEAARALRAAGYQGRLLGVDDDRAAALVAGPALDGALLLSDAFVPVPGTRGARFARAYEARHSQPPSRFAAIAYETAVLLADAASTLPRGASVSGSRLREALASARDVPSLFAGTVRLRDDGAFARPLALFLVEKGKLTFESYVDEDGRAVAVPPSGEPGAPRP